MRKLMGALLAAVVIGLVVPGAFAANGPHRHHTRHHYSRHHHHHAQ